MADFIWDYTVLRLSEALTHVLNCRPEIDLTTHQALVLTRQAIDRVLGDLKKEKRDEVVKDGAQSTLVETKQQTSPQSREETKTRTLKAPLFSYFHSLGQIALFFFFGGAKSNKEVSPMLNRNEAEERRQKFASERQWRQQHREMPSKSNTRAKTDTERSRELQLQCYRTRYLVAVSPLIAFNKEESSTTILEHFFGRRIAAAFWSIRNLLAVLAILVTMTGVICIVLVFTLPATTSKSNLLTMSIIYLIVNCTGVAILLWRMNYSLAMMGLKNFDAVYSLVEALFFAFSLSGVLCFESYGIVFCLSWFLASACFLMYDSFPVAIRYSFRFAYMLYLGSLVFIIVVLYTRVSPRLCFYRLHFVNGLSEKTQTCELSTDTRLSISLLEFCLNRGLTICLLTLKIITTAIKYPQDCVTLKSRMRLIESFSVPTSVAPATTPLPLTLSIHSNFGPALLKLEDKDGGKVSSGATSS